MEFDFLGVGDPEISWGHQMLIESDYFSVHKSVLLEITIISIRLMSPLKNNSFQILALLMILCLVSKIRFCL